MTTGKDPALLKMDSLIEQWNNCADGKCVFLSCYAKMTANVLQSNQKGEFTNPRWVDTLLHHFAGYYFTALQAYEENRTTVPVIWLLAHDVANNPQFSALQKLLMGVNAHINYDLSLTLYDLLATHWHSLSNEQQKAYYTDYVQVNEVIGQTIDVVQDEILEPTMPLMQILDTIMGPADEWLISQLITHWREKVWHNALRLLNAKTPDERTQIITQIEADAITRTDAILLKNSILSARYIW